MSLFTTLDYGDASYEVYPATLRPGASYTFQDDTNADGTKAGFRLQPLTGKPQAITSAAYVGLQEKTVTLASGRWAYFTPGGARLSFVVVP